LTPPTLNAVPVTTKSRLRGIYPAGSRIKDDKAPGGFGPCDNWPKDLGGKTWGMNGAVSLVAFPDEAVAYFKHRGIALRLVNRTGDVAAFRACDSQLYIVQEARDKDGRWYEIEDMPCAFCGNSSHRVFLKAGEYWEFRARTYSGAIKTQIRFRLDPSGEEDNAKPIYSNEFDGNVADVQFRRGPSRSVVRNAFRSGDPREEGVVAILAEVLGNEHLTVLPRVDPRAAAMRLANLGPAAKEALPALRQATKGKDKALRATAAYAIWRIDAEVEAPVRTLIDVLNSKNEHRSHWEAALWLHEMGPAAGDAVPALCEALAKGDDELRQKAAEAIAAIRSQADVAVPALTRALRDPYWYVRSSAAEALGEFGAEAKPAIPQLADALKDNDGHVKAAAALALWRIEGKTEPAVAVLIETLNGGDEDSYCRESAAQALGKIGPSAREAIPHLTAALSKDRRGLRIAAAGALWKITRQTKPALSVLIKALQDGESASESNTHEAIGVLEDMGPQAKAAVPALLAIHKRADSWGREMIQRVLKEIDPQAARELGPF
jgi:HEAT repeat protein